MSEEMKSAEEAKGRLTLRHYVLRGVWALLVFLVVCIASNRDERGFLLHAGRAGSLVATVQERKHPLDKKENVTYSPRPFPIEAMNMYKEMHSVEALQQDIMKWNLYHRKYAVVYYYCPDRAGNILHSFFTGVSWAMLTNRTILVQYDTDKDHGTTEADCEKVLRRSPWLPRWDEWQDKLPEPVPIPVDPKRQAYDLSNQVVIFPMIKDVMYFKHSEFYRNEWRDDPMEKRATREFIYSLGLETRRFAAMLFYYGVDFLFGLLFREIFTVDESLVPQPSSAVENDVFSLALHSRHTVVGDDGSHIPDEVRCLEKLLPENRSPYTCVVYMMSDRPNTLNALSDWLDQHNCSALYNEVSKSSSVFSFVDEHGPNPGVGFIQDLALASHARSALIGDTGRSSFMLLAELVVYESLVDQWDRGVEIEMNKYNDPMVPLCLLPGRYGTGYDYGPGTPLFRAARRSPALEPLRVLEEYKITKRQITSASVPPIVGILPCKIEQEEDLETVHVFLSDFVRAVVNDEAFEWHFFSRDAQHTKPAACGHLLSPKDWLLPSKSSKYGVDSPLILKPNQTTKLSQLGQRDFHSPNATRLRMLYSQGSDFLYGALYEYVFKQHHSLKPTHFDFEEGTKVAIASKISDSKQACFHDKDLELTESCNVYWLTAQRSTLPPELSHCETVRNSTQKDVSETKIIGHLRQLMWIADQMPNVLLGDDESILSLLLRERIEYVRRLNVWKLGRHPPVLPFFKHC